MRSNSQTLNQLYIAASVLLAGLVAAACGGEDPQINSQSAALVEKAASDAVIKATKKHVMADLASLAQGASAASSWLKGTPAAGFSVDGAMAAASGGSLKISGAGTSSAASKFGFSLDARFDKWQDASGVVLDGTLKLSVKITALSPPRVTVGYRGALAVSGAVEGEVDVDLSLDITGDASQVCGNVSGVDVNVKACGVMDAGSAARVEAALAAATSQLQGKLSAELSALSNQVPGVPGVPGGLLKGDAAKFDVDGVISSTLGGTMKLSGKGVKEAGGYTITLTATLNKYSSAQVALDGELKVTYQLKSLMPLSLKVQVKGAVQASGAATGKANIDLSFDVSDSDTRVCGKVAGHDFGC